MFFYHVLMLIGLNAIVFSHGCHDNQYFCKQWKEKTDICKSTSRIRSHCKKTCGICSAELTQLLSSCGASTIQHSWIINGVEAVPGAWPWIASLQHSGRHFCGATLLSPKWLVTASHCVERILPLNMREWTIKLGAHDQRKIEPTLQTFAIRSVIKHPKYNPGELLADIAMVELVSPARLNDRVAVACLPKKAVYPPLGEQCYLAGWGSITYPGAVYHTLQQTKLPVVDSNKCKYQREVVCVGNGFQNQENGKQQPNACRGDSGGPLVCQQSDGRWQLEGVASYVYTYCRYYTGYSPVNKYLDWINSYIRT